MTGRPPGLTATVFLIAMMALYLVMPALAWGSLSGLLGHPARAGMFIVGIVATVAFLFSGCNFASVNWDHVASRVTIVIGILVALVLTYLPAYGDRHGIAVWDGEIVRYAGLAIYTVGCVLRIGPMFVLKNRFRAPWTNQDEHFLVTTGFYRHIRHPSYLGQWLLTMGWFLVFRCWIGSLFCCALIPLAIPQLRKEETKLLAEFGETYATYQIKGDRWRLRAVFQLGCATAEHAAFVARLAAHRRLK
jgi:protein-S-isoprenylcysteine O-methyltransferase Ste14